MASEPIYVSEVIEKTMNPTFRNMDFACCGPGITRLENVSVKIWVRSVKAGGQWRLLLEQETGLRGLVFVGKSVRSSQLCAIAKSDR